ncbi:MAG: AAA family ATPase [Halanaerobiales bacterium]|nr:AAA family ATPase [Halanaerobiales bacterium]
MISEANIKIDGLTLIAGENDTGKSTLSKLLYTIIKSSDKSDTSQLFIQRQRSQIQKLIDEIYFFTRSNVEEADTENITIFRFLLENQLKENINEYLGFSEKDKYLLENLFKKDLKHIFKKAKFNLTILNEKFYDDIISKIVDISIEEIDTTKICEYKFLKYINSLFDGDINNKFTENNSNILLREGNTDILKITIENNKPIEFFLLDELYIKDATFIESPIVLQMSEVIYDARTSLDLNEEFSFIIDKPFINIQMKDLVTKLRQPNIPDYSESESESISQIINGNMYYDEKENSFRFKKNGESFNAINIASGIKAFGILQMLLQKGFVKERIVLILDEPEVNMHPKWQIQYAKLLVYLVEQLNVKVLITSHSPYFIEAIKVYSDKSSEVAKNTYFYLSEKNNDNVVDIIEVTEQLEKIFDKLTEPLEKLEKDNLGDLL